MILFFLCPNLNTQRKIVPKRGIDFIVGRGDTVNSDQFENDTRSLYPTQRLIPASGDLKF